MGPDNELADFLTRLIRLRQGAGNAEDGASVAIDAFYNFLNALGIEHCNFGGFKFGADGLPSINQFAATRLSDDFIEEFVEDLAPNDYVLRRAETLSAANPIIQFETGLPALGEIEAFHAPSRDVQIACAHAGIEEGVALIGDTSLIRARTGGGEGRYFGFVFGGERGTRTVLSDHGQSVEIAAFALLDQIMPQVEAAIDGFANNLTPRERDCLAKIANGSMRKAIAFDLNIALPTVDLHIAGIKRKLGADTLPEAVARGYRYGLI